MAATNPSEPNRSRTLFIDYRGQEYPLGEIVGQAIKIANDVELDNYKFHTRRIGKPGIEDLGFDVVEKQEGT